MNKYTFSGNIVKDVKFETNNGNYFCRNKIAVTDYHGTDYETTYFIPITVYNDELLGKMEEWGKGKLIELEGKVVFKNYQNKEGEWKNFFEVVVFKAEEIKFDKKETKKDNKKGGFKPKGK